MRKLICATLIMFMEVGGLYSQESYQLPPQEVVDIIDAAPEPAVSFSPNRQHMLLVSRKAMPSIADVSRRMLRLAGMRIDPAANAQFQTIFNNGIAFKELRGKSAVTIPMKDDARISLVSWSHLSNAFVFSTVEDDGTSLWLVDCAQPDKPRLLTNSLNTVMTGVEWFPDGKKILVQTVPEDRGDEPVAQSVPTGPRIQESSGNTSPTRTYQDLLQSADDEKLFSYYAESQMVIIDFSSQQIQAKTIGETQLTRGAEISPDGKHILVTTIQKPFSYLMTVGSFPKKIEVWDLDGNSKYLVADVPLEENIPIEGVRTGRRSITWMSGRDATLVWNEALDGGDPNQPAEFRDVYTVSYTHLTLPTKA